MKPSLRPPLIDFCRILRKNEGIEPGCILHLLPWFTKLILFEPLRLAEYLLYDKKIYNLELVHPPIFILGFYRNGTTLLQRMFALDSHLGYQNIFHSALPELLLCFESTLKPVFNTFSGLFHIKNAMHRIPFEWDFPGEEDVALTSLSLAESVNWGYLFPKSFDEYYEKYAWFTDSNESIDRWYENYIYWVKKLSLRYENKQLVLKSPPNTARLKILYERFPKAKFICVFRDPFQVYNSSLKFWKIICKNYALQTIPEHEIKRLVLRSFDQTMICYHKAKASIEGIEVFELSYESLIEDPFGMVNKIYEKLEIDNFDGIKTRLRNFIDSNLKINGSIYEQSQEEKELILLNWNRHILYWKKLRKIEMEHASG